MLYLYDPKTNILTETSYQYLSELTGKSIQNLMSYKSRKLKITNINCYLADENTALKQRKEWYSRESYKDETWKTIVGSDDLYLISNYGRVKRIYKTKTKFLLPIHKKKIGCLEIKVPYKGVFAPYRISTLVAHHFLPERQLGEILSHKNSIKTDNFAGNLEYTTREKHGAKYGSITRNKPVVQLNKDTLEVIDEFRSAREAGRNCYLSYQAVLDNCHKKSKTSGGFIFMFLDEYENIKKDGDQSEDF